MTTRRSSLLLLGLGAAAPVVVLSQPRQPVLIGWLETGTRESGVHLLEAFKEGMASYGLKEGLHYVIEERWLEGRMDRLPRLAQEIAAGKPRVILAQPSSLVAAVARAAPGTPIVQMGGSPLESGTVGSLARPGGTITGVSAVSASLVEKIVELLHEAMPGARRVGFLMDPKALSIASTLEHARRAIKRFGIDARFGEAIAPKDLELAISGLAKDGAQALVVLPNVWFSGARHEVMKHALAHRLPVAAGGNQYAEAGGLIGYGADAAELRRRAAYFVDRILKGAKPGDLPIEQPTKFELVVNLKTAKALGITMPQSILVRADRVIE